MSSSILNTWWFEPSNNLKNIYYISFFVFCLLAFILTLILRFSTKFTFITPLRTTYDSQTKQEKDVRNKLTESVQGIFFLIFVSIAILMLILSIPSVFIFPKTDFDDPEKMKSIYNEAMGTTTEVTIPSNSDI